MKFSPYILEQAYEYFGRPRYFWPAVLFTIFIALPCLASALDGALQ